MSNCYKIALAPWGSVRSVNGSVCEAMRATISLTLIFHPLEKEKQLMANDYLSDPLPIGFAIQKRADVILAMGFESISTQIRDLISETLIHLAGIRLNNLLQTSYAFYSPTRHADFLSLIPQFEGEIHMFDTYIVLEMPT